MKFIITGDLHLSRYQNDNLDEETKIPERLNSINNSLYIMADYAIKNKIYNFVICGDIYHNKSIIHSIAQNIFIDFIRNYKKLSFIIIDGNHDLSGKGNNTVSSLKHLSSESNVNYISEPTNMENILFVPYSFNMTDYIKNNSSEYLISHFGLNEGILNSGVSISSDIKLSDLKNKYKIVICGHYHKPQEIINDDIIFYYVGSPIELDFGEINDNKRFLLVDTKNNNIESILTQGYKKHFVFELLNNNKDEILNISRELKKEGHHVKIILKDINIDISEIKNEFIINNIIDGNITNRGITSEMSMDDKLKKYLSIKNIDNNKIEQYINVAYEIINK